MSYQDVMDEAAAAVSRAAGRAGYPESAFAVSPAKPGFGDLSCNAPFLLAAPTGRTPQEISRRLAEEYEPGRLVAGAEAHPSGYLNLAANHGAVAEAVVRASLRPGYGELDVGAGRRVVLEHTSVNPNKALHIGHVRNVVVGDCVARILRMAGYEVSVLNYVDDSGSQVADILLGFSELGYPEEPPGGKKFDHYCGDDVYVGATREIEARPELAARRARILRDLEDGGSEAARAADRVTGRVLACQLETCWALGAEYDCLNFESQIIRSGLWARVFERMREAGLVELERGGKNGGCWVVRGSGGEDDKVVVRSDGTATYMAKDIPYAAWKLGLVDDPFSYEPHGAAQPGGRRLWRTALGGGGPRHRFAGATAVTVIDSRQARLQRIVASLMGRFKSDGGAYVHLGYESVALSPATAASLGLDTGGRAAQMSGRRGLYVSADSVLEALRGRAEAETRRRNPGMPGDEARRIAGEVAVATVRYEMVRQDLDKVIAFDMERSMSLEGDTAPYIQYSYARAARIMERAGAEPDPDASYGLLAGERERALVREIGMFGVRVREAADNLSPKVVARYCHGLAVAFNGFYESHRVVGAGGPELSNARACLVSSYMSVLRRALWLVGAAAPGRM